MPIARKGKIARLPASIRDEVNRQLLDGKSARHILAWLNADTAVTAIMAVEFDGQPVSASNLSQWRRGGFRSWENTRRTEAKIEEIKRMFPGDEDQLQLSLTRNMALICAAHMMADLKALDSLETTGARPNPWRELRLGIQAMQRLQLDSARLNALRGGRTDDTPSDEDHERSVRQILGIPENFPRINPETDLFEGPGAEALNEQRERLKKQFQEKAAPKAETA
jgi:hypothetical protein